MATQFQPSPSFYGVPPVKGVFRGPKSSELEAAVTMSRLDPQTGARA